MPCILMAKKRPGREIYQTLAGHTEDALAALSRHLQRHRSVLERVVAEQGAAFPEFCAVLFLAVFLHDLGKATREFQARLRLETLDRDVSHTFFALPLVHTTLPAEPNTLVRVLALSHHTQPFDRLYYSFHLLPRVHYLVDEIAAFINTYPSLYAKYGRVLFSSSDRPLAAAPPPTGEREEIRAEVEALKREVLSRPDTARTRALYTLAITILKQCDGEASRIFSAARPAEGTVCGALLETVSAPADSPGKDAAHPAPGPPAAEKRGIYRQAGLRRVKTILSHALAVQRSRVRERLIWICPGQLVPRKTHAALAALCGPENTGLVHALSYFPADPRMMGEPAGRQNGNGIALKYGDRIFSRPVTVATVDHLVFCLVHGFPQADYALGNLLTAVVVLDGLPAPGSRAREYTLDALTLLGRMKVPCLVVREGENAPWPPLRDAGPEKDPARPADDHNHGMPPSAPPPGMPAPPAPPDRNRRPPGGPEPVRTAAGKPVGGEKPPDDQEKDRPEQQPPAIVDAEELTAGRPPATNLAEVFRRCTVFGPSPLEVRFGPAPLIDLWPPSRRLIDVIPLSHWRPEMSAHPEEAVRRQIKIPLARYLAHPQEFTVVDGTAEKYVLWENAPRRRAYQKPPE